MTLITKIRRMRNIMKIIKISERYSWIIKGFIMSNPFTLWPEYLFMKYCILSGKYIITRRVSSVSNSNFFYKTEGRRFDDEGRRMESEG